MKHPPSSPKGGALKRNHFFALRAKGLTLEDDDVCKSLFSLFNLVSSL